MSPDPRDLADALAHEADAESARPVDLDAVLRGSRARRRARRRAIVGATASIAGLLAVGGLVFAVGSMGPRSASSTADGTVAVESGSSDAAESPSSAEGGADAGGAPVAPQDEAQFGEDLRLIAPQTLNACGAPLAPATDASTMPLTAAVEPTTRSVPSGSESTVEVLVTNEGATAVEGVLSAPAITVSEAGTTVWHPRLGDEPAGSDPVTVSLAPGESVALTGAFTAASCAVGGEESLGTSELEPLAAGSYGLSAAIAFTPSAGTPGGIIVSPAASVPVEAAAPSVDGGSGSP
jgi:hypothetical protein